MEERLNWLRTGPRVVAEVAREGQDLQAEADQGQGQGLEDDEQDQKVEVGVAVGAREVPEAEVTVQAEVNPEVPVRNIKNSQSPSHDQSHRKRMARRTEQITSHYFKLTELNFCVHWYMPM